MPDETSSGSVDATTEPAPEITEVQEQQPQSEVGKTSLADALKAAAIADGSLAAIIEPPKEGAEAEPDPEAESEEEKEPEAAQQETEPPKGLAIGEQITWYKDHGQKAPWYLSRIAEQTVTIAKRTERAEKAEREKAEIEAKLQTASSPPTPKNPFADISDPNQLNKLENDYEQILEFATVHPNGSSEIPIGTNPDGTPRFAETPEEIGVLRYAADKAIRKDIPMRREFLRQQAAFVAARQQADAEAEVLYPDLKNEESPFTNKVNTLIKQNPLLQYVLGPKVVTWVARAVKGEELENGNADHKGDDATTRILQSARTKVAPTTTKTRQMPVRGNQGAAEVESAKKRFMENPNDAEAAAAYTAAMLMQSKRGTATRLEPVS